MESGGGRNDPRPSTAEEEATKRNTDCVYFLASPLTCKKGSECEYRHSEGARVNPRDCKFWFSGSCLNPKCLFRHPPLDGLVGNAVATSGPASQMTAAMHLPPPSSSAYNSSRSNVPCYYFQMGTCLKGDKCSFMHFPQPAAKPAPKQKVIAPVSTDLDAHKKDAWKIKDCSIQQNLSNSLSMSAKDTPSSAKMNITLDFSSHKLVPKGNLPPIPVRNVLPTSQTAGVLASTSARTSTSTSLLRPRSLHSQSDKLHLNDREAGEILEEPSGVGYPELKRPLTPQPPPSLYQNEMWADEVFRESSPGFDVIVDDVVSDADYLHENDGFRGGYIEDGRNLNHHHHSGHHDSAARLDRDLHHLGTGEEDRHGTSFLSERALDRPQLPSRRSAHRFGSPDDIDESDLRHRLRKHRRLNGSLPVTVSGHESVTHSRRELKTQDRYSRNSYRDQRQLLRENNSVSSRLRGRITLPKEASPDFSLDLQGGASWGRQHRDKISPARPSSIQARLGERLSRKSVEDSSSHSRNLASQRKEKNDVDPLDFAAPRSLAELKGAKADTSCKNIPSISSLEHTEMKTSKVAGSRDSQVLVPFEGPKPLATLLNSSEAEPNDDATLSIKNDIKTLENIEVGFSAPKADPVPEIKPQDILQSDFEDAKTVVAEDDQIQIPSEIEQVTFESREAADDEDVDYTDHREGEYVYETVEGQEYNAEDDENMDLMNVDLDDEDEDEDDFAKKIGLIFS